jgi:asparagine synthase (glutamine-hydrolysing)
MCGIAGGVFWDGIDPSAAERAVHVMVGALAHRGPDGEGQSTVAVRDTGDATPLVVFGHRRLAILDLTSAGAQPMGRSGEPWITYNGEIYNFADLKRELEAGGAQFHTATDTEVLLRAYDAWGLDALTRLRGMFAFALWDPRTARLVIARDRLGIKPLYYYRGDAFLLFASEVRALLATGMVPRHLDATALWQYLGSQSIPAPRTLVRDVRALEPATWMTIDRNGCQDCGAYWNMFAATGPVADSPAAARHDVSALLHDAIETHMVSDVPVGAFLSGGIDSSAVVALMKQAGRRPRTFSIGFDERVFDESAHAQLVARTFGTEHTHIQFTEEDLLEQLPDALAAMDQPTGDGVNTFVISRAVRAQGIAVALSGLGGDEIFGGYPSFSRLDRIADAGRFWGRWPGPVRAAAASAVRSVTGSSIAASKAAAVIETDGSLSAMFPLLRRVLSTEQRRALMSEALLEQIADRDDPYVGLLARAYQQAPDAGVFARVSFAEARTYMHDVLLRDTDQMSMAHGLEVRVPLLDHQLVEYVVGLPDDYKRANGTPKRLLVESLDGLLPDSVVHRPKQGFTLPFDVWMRGRLRPFCESHLGRGSIIQSFLRTDTVDRMWKSFLGRGPEMSWSRIWLLVVLDAWLEHHELTCPSTLQGAI